MYFTFENQLFEYRFSIAKNKPFELLILEQEVTDKRKNVPIISNIASLCRDILFIYSPTTPFLYNNIFLLYCHKFIIHNLQLNIVIDQRICPLRITVSIKSVQYAYGINSIDGISFVINTLAFFPTVMLPAMSLTPIA